MKQSSLARSVAQNIWLSNGTRIFMGWVSILNYYQFKQLLVYQIIVCGKTSYNYDNQPMLQQLNWKQKKKFHWLRKSFA
jgi:nicotinate-nucleotide--dimethylbenzimidazole phosphoribosyltransferase